MNEDRVRDDAYDRFTWSEGDGKDMFMAMYEDNPDMFDDMMDEE